VPQPFPFRFPFSFASFFRCRSRSRSLSEPQLRCSHLCVATMRFPIVSGSSIVLSLYLSQTTSAQEPGAFRNGTVSLGSSPLIHSKRATTCSGTCAECYGSGSIYCGANDACYNPTIGESCCAEYNYSCSYGYYCAPKGLDMQCCSDVSTLRLSFVRPPWPLGRWALYCREHTNNSTEHFHRRVHCLN
jgi:hypothetical protein